nr:cytochrome b [Conchiformibius kuhniae]UOP05641.1 cytochrome b [Conchiformibius kuhniae]
MQPDSRQRYGSVSRFLHWTMAVLFGFMLFTAAAWNYDEDYFSLVGYHKSAGFVLMVLALLRVAWALGNRTRRPRSHVGAHIGHGVLYVLMLAVPAVALMRQYGSARGSLEVFGITVLPAAPERIGWLVKAGGWHGSLAWLLFALAAGHILFAVVHQIRGGKIINRMAGRTETDGQSR